MTVANGPAAPEPVSRRTRVIRQRAWGWFFGWAAVGVGGLWLLALLERAFVKSPASAQLWIIPLGLVGAMATWRSYARLGPQRNHTALVVSPERLEYRQADQPTTTLERSDVALIEVLGHPMNGAYTIIVRDDRSRPIGIWTPRLAGWKLDRVVHLLRQAGYPAWRYDDVYDGRFQAQTLGQRPRVARIVRNP